MAKSANLPQNANSQKFETAAIRHAREQDVDVVVCGHIHHANLRQDGSVMYANSGDWVEHCTAIIEQENGSLELVNWAKESTDRLDVRALIQSLPVSAVARGKDRRPIGSGAAHS